MHNDVFVESVLAIIGLLSVAAVSAVVMKRLRFPYTVGLVVVGVGVAFLSDEFSAVGDILANLKFGPAMIMFIFIPLLIFESAFNMEVRLLLRNLVPTLGMAGPGLLLSTALVGVLVHYFTPLPLESALIFGCLISATDPVAVIALFKEVGGPKRLTVLVEGESVFNDATAIVTFQLILSVAVIGVLDQQAITQGVSDFFVVFFGGLLVGLVFGYVIARTIPLIGEEPLVHITLTLVSAYGAFIVAEHFLSTSGIMAVLGAGLVIGYYGPVLYKPRVRQYLEMFWEDASFIANSLIFLMLGLSEKVFLSNAHANMHGLLRPVLIAILIVLLARAAVVYSLVPLLNLIPGSRPVESRYKPVMAWGGLRGAVAVALAMSLPSYFPYRWLIVDFTFGVTLFMLVFNATTIAWLIRKLGLDKPSALEQFMRVHARLAAKRSVSERLQDIAANSTSRVFNDTLSHAVRKHYEQQERQLEAELAELRSRIGEDRVTRRELLWQRAIAIERQTYRKRFEAGLLSLDGLRELERCVGQREHRVEERIHVDLEPQLPSDRVPRSPLWRLLYRVVSRGGLLRRWQTQRRLDLSEETSALATGCRAVLDEIAALEEFSRADEQDVAECRVYYEQLEALAMRRLQWMERRFAVESRVAQSRVIQRLASDLEEQAIRRLSEAGEIPKSLAEQLQREVEQRELPPANA